MTKYEPITFTKLSEAIAYVEEGGKLYQLDAGHAYSLTPTSLAAMSGSLATGGVINAFTDAPKPKWHEKLDGTVESGVLCWVDDGDDGEEKNIDLVVDIDEARTYGSYAALTCTWTNATPLTRTEIQKLMDNAPEEV